MDPKDSPEAQRVRGDWHMVKGRLREMWGDLTDDDLDRLEGRREQLAGYLEALGGRSRAQVERDLDDAAQRAGYSWR